MSEQIPGPKISPLSFLNNIIKSTNNKTPQGNNEIWNTNNTPKKYLQNESSDKEISETLIESQKELQNKPKMGAVVETRTMTLAQNMIEDGITRKEMKELNELEPEEVVEVMAIYNDAVGEDTCFLNDCPQNDEEEIDKAVDSLLEATGSDKEAVAQAAEEILEEAVEITIDNDKFEVTEHLVEVANDKSNPNCAAAASVVSACEDIFIYYSAKLISYFGYDWFQNTLQTIIKTFTEQKKDSIKQNTATGTSQDKKEQSGYSGMNVEEIIQSDKCRDIDGNLYSEAVHSLANKLVAHPESFSEIDMNKLSVADKIVIEAYYNRNGGDFKHDMEVYKNNKK